jgi:enterochelin esterase-like enzyme
MKKEKHMKNDSRFSIVGSLMAGSIILFVAGSSQALNGTITPVTFTGPITHGSITFNIYLPAGYSSGSTRYPVIYNLHGNTGSPYSDNTVVPPALEAAVASAIIGPAIIVFPNGYGNSMWADSWDMTKPAETNVIREVIPYVDSHYRTIASHEARVIMGMSMGGFGCLDFAFKFPDTFCCAVSHAAAIDDNWITADADHPGVFNHDSAYFERYSPWTNLKLNANAVRNSIAMRMVCGTADGLLPYNRAMRDSLTKKNIPVSYAEVTGIGHDLNGLMAQQGNNDFRFIASHLNLSPTSIRSGISEEKSAYVMSVMRKGTEIIITISRQANQPIPQLQILDLAGKLVQSINPGNIDAEQLQYHWCAPAVGKVSGAYVCEFSDANLTTQKQILIIQ